MAFFNNKRRDFSIQPPRQQVDSTPFFVTDSANIDFTLENLNLTANLTTTGITAGTYGSPTLIPVVTLDIYGRVTGISTTSFSAAGILLQTDGITNATQTTLNLVSGTNMAITDDGLGNITFDATGGGGPAIWGSITGTLTSQTDLINYLTTNYYPLTGNPSGFLTTAVTSVAATVPTPTNPAFSVNVPNPTTTPSIDITANGIVSQYIRGDGSLANFPTTSGGGSSVSYYLNGSVNQGIFGGSTYYQMSKTPVLGGGTTFTRLNSAGNGLIAQFITDANDPSLLSIPGGNWILELFFKASSGGGSPSYYVELYKYDTIGLTFTLIATDVLTPEGITNGTVLDVYFTALAVPTTPLALTDRLALRVFVNTSGRNIELHTENGNLCQIITTFTTGITALNGLTDQIQNFATPGTTGLAPNWNSVSPDHTLNIPLASAAGVTAGLISKADYDTFNGKQDALILTTTGTSGPATLTGATLNIPQYSGGSGGITALTGDVAASGTGSVVATLNPNYKEGGATVIYDGGGSLITNGKIAYTRIPYKGTITGWFLAADQSGSCSIVVKQGLFSPFPPTTTIITATLSGTQTAQAPSVLSLPVAAGDWLSFTISGVATVTWVNLSLTITKIL